MIRKKNKVNLKEVGRGGEGGGGGGGGGEGERKEVHKKWT